MSAEDDVWLPTLGLIRMFRRGACVIASLLRESLKVRDMAVAIRNGTIDQRGTVFGSWHYRVQGDHLVVSHKKDRIEFNYVHPDALSAYLLQRHITLNRKLPRWFPQYVGLPLSKGLDQLLAHGLIRGIDGTESLFVLTQAGLEWDDEKSA